jgi:hypothetical protein
MTCHYEPAKHTADSGRRTQYFLNPSMLQPVFLVDSLCAGDCLSCPLPVRLRRSRRYFRFFSPIDYEQAGCVPAQLLEPTKACLRATIRDASAGTISHKVKAVKILWFGRRPPVVVVAMSVLFGCARCRDDCRGLVQKLDGKVKLVTPARNESARQSPAIPFPDTLNP